MLRRIWTVFELLPQPGDVDVHGARRDVRLLLSDLREDSLARQHLAAMVSGVCNSCDTPTPKFICASANSRERRVCRTSKQPAGCAPKFPGYELGPMWAVKAGASGDISVKPGESSSAGVAWYRYGAGPHFSSAVFARGSALRFPFS